jgi:hypothetical protein|tara:strand:+ start:454 stop:702 length:249 start_codon:yes stop_codon:yes gene_type:complete
MTDEIQDAEVVEDTEAGNIQISMNDLMVMRAVFDTATQAGVFKAADLSTVGGVFDKLNLIVEDFIKKNPPPTKTEGESAPAA